MLLLLLPSVANTSKFGYTEIFHFKEIRENRKGKHWKLFSSTKVLNEKNMLLESIMYWDSLKMISIDLTRNNCRWCSMLFKTCYCPGPWKYDAINCAFSNVRLDHYYSSTAECCQKHGCVSAIMASSLTGFTYLAKAEMLFKVFFLLCNDWSHSIHDSYRWCFCTDQAQHL